jgi:hypothetical protein
MMAESSASTLPSQVDSIQPPRFQRVSPSIYPREDWTLRLGFEPRLKSRLDVCRHIECNIPFPTIQ